MDNLPQTPKNQCIVYDDNLLQKLSDEMKEQRKSKKKTLLASKIRIIASKLNF
jgi:hypothetical protein